MLAAAPLLHAQGPAAAGPEANAGAVREVAGVFAREYFDAALARTVAAELHRRAEAGRYREAASPAALAGQLNADFYELTRDKHIVVAERRPVPTGSSGGGRRNVPTTAGFRRTEILAGNVGLLDLAFFLRPVEHQDALAAAMRTLQPAEALILDMRDNGGGSPETVALLVSYLLDAAGQPLFEIVRRDGSRDVYRTDATPPAARDGRRPIYVLTSPRSFSGGEGLAFLLQDLKRAVVVGEVTAGAANPGRPYPAGEWFEVTVPNGQLLTAVSRRNWEGTGVTPDVAAPAADALRRAHLRALDDLIAAATSEQRRNELRRIQDALRVRPR